MFESSYSGYIMQRFEGCEPYSVKNNFALWINLINYSILSDKYFPRILPAHTLQVSCYLHSNLMQRSWKINQPIRYLNFSCGFTKNLLVTYLYKNAPIETSRWKEKW